MGGSSARSSGWCRRCIKAGLRSAIAGLRGQCARAAHDGATGVGLAAMAIRQCVALRYQRRLATGGSRAAAHWDRHVGAETSGARGSFRPDACRSRKAVGSWCGTSRAPGVGQLHRRLGGTVHITVLDNLKEGVLTDIYEPALNPLPRRACPLRRRRPAVRVGDLDRDQAEECAKKTG